MLHVSTILVNFGDLFLKTMQPWIVNIFLSVKDDAFIRVSKHFPWPLNKIVYAIRPSELGNAREDEFAFASVKAKERMSQGFVPDRADFMNYILKYNDEKG